MCFSYIHTAENRMGVNIKCEKLKKTSSRSMIKTTSAIIFSILLLVTNSVFAAARYSICNGGNWNDPNCWSATPGGPSCGCVPNPGSDDIYIQTNINLNVHLTGSNAIGGSLTIAAGVSLSSQNHDITVKTNATLIVNGTLNVRNSDFQNNSNITISTGATMEVWGSFVNSNNSDQVTLDGTLILHGSCYNGNGGNISGSGTVIYSNQGCTGGGSWAVANSGTLPIELLTFSATMNSDDGADIYWATATETNNDFFTIEKTYDATYYDVVGIVDGAGTSITPMEYFAIDPFPYPGLSYYRLKQTDFDGTYKYSNLVALNNTNEGVEVLVYPNPVEGQNLSVEIAGNSDEEILVVVTDVFGREFYSKVVVLNGGRYKLLIDPSKKLAPGIYMVMASSHNNRLFSQKVVVK